MRCRKGNRDKSVVDKTRERDAARGRATADRHARKCLVEPRRQNIRREGDGEKDDDLNKRLVTKTLFKFIDSFADLRPLRGRDGNGILGDSLLSRLVEHASSRTLF